MYILYGVQEYDMGQAMNKRKSSAPRSLQKTIRLADATKYCDLCPFLLFYVIAKQ